MKCTIHRWSFAIGCRLGFGFGFGFGSGMALEKMDRIWVTCETDLGLMTAGFWLCIICANAQPHQLCNCGKCPFLQFRRPNVPKWSVCVFAQFVQVAPCAIWQTEVQFYLRNRANFWQVQLFFLVESEWNLVVVGLCFIYQNHSSNIPSRWDIFWKVPKHTLYQLHFVGTPAPGRSNCQGFWTSFWAPDYILIKFYGWGATDCNFQTKTHHLNNSVFVHLCKETSKLRVNCKMVKLCPAMSIA